MSSIRLDDICSVSLSNKALALYSEAHDSNTVNILMSGACTVTLITR